MPAAFSIPTTRPGSAEDAVPVMPAGFGSPPHSCGVAILPLASAALRHSFHPVGVAGARKPYPPIPDGPDGHAPGLRLFGGAKDPLLDPGTDTLPPGVEDLDLVGLHLTLPEDLLDKVISVHIPRPPTVAFSSRMCGAPSLTGTVCPPLPQYPGLIFRSFPSRVMS